MSTTHTKPPVSGGANAEADPFRIISRTAVNNIIKECLTEKGAGTYVFLPPYIVALIHQKLEKMARKLELDIKADITDRVIAQSVTDHTAHVVEQKKNKAAQLELFHDNQA